jgi:hypothetical protein
MKWYKFMFVKKKIYVTVSKKKFVFL